MHGRGNGGQAGGQTSAQAAVATSATTAAATGALPIHAFYDGWLEVEQSAIQTMDTYVTESMQAFAGGWVEARQIRWTHPVESICSTTERCYMVNLSLGGWTTGGSARNLRAQGTTEAIGRMWLVPPDQTLQFNSIEGQSRSIRCLLDAEMFEGFLADIPGWRGREQALRAPFNLGGGQIEWLLRRMYRELRNPDFGSAQVIETLAKQLTVEIIRALDLRGEGAAFHTGGLAPWRLRLIRERLWSEAALPNLDELAELCDMTVRHLSRAFRSETGKTLGKFVETAMVDRANRMLRAGQPVRAVAAALGYASAGSFAMAFRRATGLLPSQVRTERPH
jgi:AraC family transcriptional regulator